MAFSIIPPPVSATDSSKIPLATVDAKGDLLVGTANDTVARQAVGSNRQVLQADSAQTNGIKWVDGQNNIASDISLTADGAWHDLYDLSAGVHVGELVLSYSDTTPTRIAWVRYDITNTTITYASIQTGWTGVFVNAGSAANGNIALQISGGKVQYKCGTDFTNSPKLGVRFDGKVA